MNYRGSYRRLLGNSRAAMVGAVEIYNKPQFEYRDECFVILLINAWELALKALLSKSGHSVFYKKKRGEPYRTLTWQDALNRATHRRAWPSAKLSEQPVRKNLELLATYRDGAVHFYNEPRFGVLIYALAQTSICNYRDLLEAAFKVKLRDDFNWNLLPLGLDPPLDPIEYLGGSSDASVRPSSKAALQFVQLLRDAARELEDQDIDTGRLLTAFKLNLQSVKKITQSDIVVGVTGDIGESDTIVTRPLDPNKSWPLLQKHVLEEIGELHGKRFTSYDFQAITRAYSLRERSNMCWVDEETQWPRWSREVLTFIRRLSAEDVVAARSLYAEYLRRQRAAA